MPVVKSLRHDGHSNRSSSPAKAGDPVSETSVMRQKNGGVLDTACTGYDESLGEVELGTSTRHCEEQSDEAIQHLLFRSHGLLRFARNDDQHGICRRRSHFLTLLASILIDGSSSLVVNAVSTANGFSMPRGSAPACNPFSSARPPFSPA